MGRFSGNETNETRGRGQGCRDPKHRESDPSPKYEDVYLRSLRVEEESCAQSRSFKLRHSALSHHLIIRFLPSFLCTSPKLLLPPLSFPWASLRRERAQQLPLSPPLSAPPPTLTYNFNRVRPIRSFPEQRVKAATEKRLKMRKGSW